MKERLPSLEVTQSSDEVLIATEPIVRLGAEDIRILKDRALKNPRQRIRVCAHKDTDDRVHEMLIILTSAAYVRPHKHTGKSESFHVIEGTVDVVIFDDAGGVSEVIRMGDYASGRRFYYRLDLPVYHTLLITSPMLVFHEVTNGPFRRDETVFAPWGPEEQDMTGRESFMDRVRAAVGRQP